MIISPEIEIILKTLRRLIGIIIRARVKKRNTENRKPLYSPAIINTLPLFHQLIGEVLQVGQCLIDFASKYLSANILQEDHQ